MHVESEKMRIIPLTCFSCLSVNLRTWSLTSLHPSSPLGLARLGSALLSLHGQKMWCKKCYTKNVIQKCCSWRVGCKKCYACMSILTRYMHVSMAYHGHWAHRRCICHGTLSASSLHKHAWIIKRIVATCMSMLCTCRLCCSRPRGG